MIKANCIDSVKESSLIYKDIRDEMTSAGFLVKNAVELDPYQKDHMAFIMKENGLQR
jgi:fibrillarin-like pre-rRNA processing protein